MIDKPAGWTSHDVVAKIRSALRHEFRIRNSEFGIPPSAPPKVGHTGTLDPFATGLLILVVGKYTKRAEQFSKMDKTYEAELILGKTSTTGDPEGEITEKSDKKPSEDEVRAVLGSFLGEIYQKPHKYSAIKIGGQRAYTLARRGKQPVLKARQVRVYRLEVTEYEYPKLRIVTEVSSGTYIRTLAENIGEKLGTGAYLSSLRRLKVGDFDIKNALSQNDLTDENIQKHLQK